MYIMYIGGEGQRGWNFYGAHGQKCTGLRLVPVLQT
jgi:hypothetical protein